MLFRDRIQKQCDEHNEAVRRVVFRSGFDLRRMFNSRENCSRSMLITGGHPGHREEILEMAILETKRRLAVPMVVFTSSIALEKRLIDDFRGSAAFGPLRVVSAEYPTYRFFHGLSPNLTGDFFAAAAAAKRFLDGSDLYRYTTAFMTLLEAVDDTPSLSSMTELAKASNTQLENAFSARGLSNGSDDVFSRGGDSFRSLLAVFSSSTAFLTDREENGKSLTQLLKEGRDFTLLIRADETDDLPLIALYFSVVLKACVSKPFIIAADDGFMVSEGFRNQLGICRKRQTVLFSFQNAMLYAEDEAAAGLNQHYARRVLLLEEDNISPADRQSLLDEFSTFSEFVPTETSTDTPHVLWSIEHSNARQIMQVTRPKVLLEECAGYKVVVSGYNGPEITVARYLT